MSRSVPKTLLTQTGTSLESDERLALFAKAIGHPARIAIVRFLAAQKQCYCGRIVEELPLAQSTVSQHLNMLKDAGLIRGTVDGPRMCYCLDQDNFQLLRGYLSDLFVLIEPKQPNCDSSDCCL